MIAHAAGESFYYFSECRHSSVLEHSVSNRRVGGSIPSGGSIIAPSVANTVVVVLSVKNLGKLDSLHFKLLDANVGHVAIREPDLPWNNDLMAIGCLPADKDTIFPFVRELRLYPQSSDEPLLSSVT
jgi:hypothetical protein